MRASDGNRTRVLSLGSPLKASRGVPSHTNPQIADPTADDEQLRLFRMRDECGISRSGAEDGAPRRRGRSALSRYLEGVAPTPKPTVSSEPDLAALAAQAAKDPSARAFADEVKAAVADGSIWDQVANQTELEVLIEEHRR